MLSPLISQATAISAEDFADLFDESEVLETSDTGNVLVHKCLHPSRGEIHLISQFTGEPWSVYQEPSAAS